MAKKGENTPLLFSPDDWIVHEDHGIGQIISIDKKSLGSKETTYYRIKVTDYTVWVPVDKDDLLRPVRSSEDFSQAIDVLKRPSRQMSTVFQSRLARIRKAKDKGTPKALARVVRDLWARQKRRGKLSNTEHDALRNMIQQLLAEWSVSMGIDKKKTREKLYLLLRRNALAGD